MDNFKWEATLLFIPLFIFVLALCFYFNKPKKINFWFGYRTKSSMRNNDTWNTANKIFSYWFLILSSGLFFLTFLLILVLKKEGLINIFGSVKTFFFYIIGFVNVVIIAPLLVVEYQLNKIFNATGDRK